LTKWSWDDYLAVNFACGWVTPFDPRTHVRTADFITWKQRVLEIARDDPAIARQIIHEESSVYRQLRRYTDLDSLANDCCSLELDRWRNNRLRRLTEGAKESSRSSMQSG
jgi:hypothetical protein